MAAVFHVRQTKDLHPGSSGFIQDGIGPIAFASKEEAESFIEVYGYENTEILGPLDAPVDLNNPGGHPQVGSLRNPALPGRQVHPLEIAVAHAKGASDKDVDNMTKESEQKMDATHPGHKEAVPGAKKDESKTEVTSTGHHVDAKK